MDRRKLASLVIANIAMLITLGLFSFTPQSAEAQLGGIKGGDFLMIAGKPPGKTESTIYVVDLNTARMIAVTYDQSRKSLMTLARRDMAMDFR